MTAEDGALGRAFRGAFAPSDDELNARGKRLLQQQTPPPLRVTVRVKRKAIEATVFDFALRWPR